MPELPEVEVLVCHLSPLLKGKRVRRVEVCRTKVLSPTTPRQLSRALLGARFIGVSRRGKYLLFDLRRAGQREPLVLLGHLGMTGRIYLQERNGALPRHTAVIINLGKMNLIYEDTRYFGRLTLDTSPLAVLGPEPLTTDFRVADFASALKRSAQAIKVKLLDQSLVVGVGNIYASEALFRAGISPRLAARRLTRKQVERLWQAIRGVLSEAIELGSTVPLDWAGTGQRDGLFYYGRAAESPDYYEERLLVYDREGKPCSKCGAAIKRFVQAARSTFYCPRCQHS
ncbi:MAG: bifunctional DNA-formamidopyrimidine glycosylase/DNA-(apurinic or apyrimidinic site) lyase [Verrucomicrobia bacterium]|nr:bifunctional DNA-formamidopyrimidine glycosylase/DNA-(apurinic or apyrimidinic site) lyase [Verrucomicrobiota bacterium]